METTKAKKKAGRISPTLMGDYDNTTVYRRLDWVYYGGTSYICKKNNTLGIAPSTSIERWQKMIELPTELNMVFDEVTKRENISSGEKLSVILGKIKKIIADLKLVAFSGDYNDLSNQPTMYSLNYDTHVIDVLIDISQINEIGFWRISTIDADYAAQIGIENPGDFYALCCSYNKSGVFANILLFSPRLLNKYYYINVWQGAATAVKSVLKTNLLNTIEQINANTAEDNVASALALKAAIADFNNKITKINNNLTSKSPFDIVLKRDYDYKTASGWRNILQWMDNNVRTGYLSENVKKGGVELHLNNERGDIFVNGNSINSIVNNINNLKTSKIWNVILATQADGTHEIPSLDGTEVLLMLGYVYRVEATMTIPANIFKTAKGEGGIILFEGLTIEVVDDTHIRVVGLTNNYLFRVFVR